MFYKSNSCYFSGLFMPFEQINYLHYYSVTCSNLLYILFALYVFVLYRLNIAYLSLESKGNLRKLLPHMLSYNLKRKKRSCAPPAKNTSPSSPTQFHTLWSNTPHLLTYLKCLKALHI